MDPRTVVVRNSPQKAAQLAYTAVVTMLAKLEEKSHVAHRSEGRVSIYRPRLKQQLVSQSMVSDLANRIFSGDVTERVCHLLDGCDVSQQEETRLRQLIRDKEEELKDES